MTYHKVPQETADDVKRKIKEIYEKYPDQTFGKINVRRKTESRHVYNHSSDKYGSDWGEGYGDIIDIRDGGDWKIFLDHSCDEWVIGNVSDAKEFNDNLSAALNYCNSYD